jgi:hypothetical protein
MTIPTPPAATPEMLAKNVQAINERVEAGLDLLRAHYTVRECAVDPVLANPIIGGRPHHARRFDIDGVGNLLVMTVTETETAQLSSFVITPYAKNLPMFSTDYVYSGDQRFFLIEIYDLAVRHDETFDTGIARFATLKDAWSDMLDFPVKPCWYDEIRPVCLAKAYPPEQDELAIDRFLMALRAFITLERETPVLAGADIWKKWQLNSDYANRLIDEGGVSTDLFTQSIGAENTRRFFHEVFFGASCYKPAE